jgi:hypothetical protein
MRSWDGRSQATEGEIEHANEDEGLCVDKGQTSAALKVMGFGSGVKKGLVSGSGCCRQTNGVVASLYAAIAQGLSPIFFLKVSMLVHT